LVPKSVALQGKSDSPAAKTVTLPIPKCRLGLRKVTLCAVP
jgi:hypothetical protein